MKPNVRIEVTRGNKCCGWQGYTRELHPHATGFIWCAVSAKAPYPLPGEKPQPHHELKVLSISQLTTI